MRSTVRLYRIVKAGRATCPERVINTGEIYSRFGKGCYVGENVRCL